MNIWRLLLRNLRYFWKADLAVAAGMAVATAVLTGALIVGDSVRGSLRQLAVQRLGPVDHALIGPDWFESALADRLRVSRDFSPRFEKCVAGAMVRGGASVPTEDPDARPIHVPNVQIVGLSDWVTAAPGRCVLSGRLADELGVKVGDRIILNLPRVSGLPLEATLARRGRTDLLSGLSVVVGRVARDAGMESSFSLTPSQRLPRIAWVNLDQLQRAVGQPGRANLLLVQAGRGGSESELNRLLAEAVSLDDYGLTLAAEGKPSVSGISSGPDSDMAPAASGPDAESTEAVLTCRRTYFDPQLADASVEAARAVGAEPRLVTAGLASEVIRLPARRLPAEFIHYAIIAGISHLADGPIEPDHVVVNQWAADQLKALPGDPLRLTCFYRDPDSPAAGIATSHAEKVLARIIPMSGLGADPTLTPSFEGLTDEDSISQWNPPADFSDQEKARLRAYMDRPPPQDEEYWQEYRAAPKLFVSLATARKLWSGGGFGDLTSVRVPAEQADDFARELRAELSRSGRLRFRPIRAEQLAAASGTTDFAQLFLGFSFFLIVSAGLLVALLFRLAVEQRSRQLGLLAAMGFGRLRLASLCLGEGAVLAAVGVAVGSAGAVGYGWLMMAGLRNWWIGAVGTTALRLHLWPPTLALGAGVGFVIAMCASAWGVSWAARTSPAVLLAGSAEQTRRSYRRFWLGGWLSAAWAMLAIVLFALPVFGWLSAEIAFLAGGACALAAVLAVMAWHWRRQEVVSDQLAGWGAVIRLGMRNAARHPGRSVLTVGLLAAASFVLVTVGTMRQERIRDVTDKSSGAGGFALVIQTDVPLTGDLNTPTGRKLLGIRSSDPSDESVWERTRFVPFRRLAGQDASCLNMTRPDSPTILGATRDFIESGGFAFSRTLRREANPWELLLPADQDDAIPMITDDATARYSLHLDLGQTMTITDGLGRAQRLRLVATLADSIFQGELLVSEANFRGLFPSQGGFGMVLAPVEPSGAERIRAWLMRDLADFGVSVELTSDRLAGYAQVANTYLTTFQSLGGLGLLLGTAGLAVVLLRSLLERRAELALLAAIGFDATRRLILVLAENAWLLLLGLLVGGGAALIGAGPVVFFRARQVNLLGLSATVVGIALAGMAVLAVTAAVAGRRYSPADLRRE